jgi:hypothetical protein
VEDRADSDARHHGDGMGLLNACALTATV